MCPHTRMCAHLAVFWVFHAQAGHRLLAKTHASHLLPSSFSSFQNTDRVGENRRSAPSLCQPCAGIARVELLALWRRANFKARRRTLCRNRACPFARCGAVRILKVGCRPSARIARVESLSLWRRANFRSRPAIPLRVSCASNRARCGTMRIFSRRAANLLPFFGGYPRWRVERLATSRKLASSRK